ncbi:Glutamate receptor ionotropic, NMDA 3A, partial [Frankliniella fusca]
RGVLLALAVHAACHGGALGALRPPPPPGTPHHLDAMVSLIAERSFPPGRLLVVTEGACMQGAVRGVVRDGRWPVVTVGARPVYRRRGRLRPDRVTSTPCCGWLDGAGSAAGVVLAGDHNHVRRTLNHVRFDYPALWNGSALFLFVMCAVPAVRPDSLLRWLASKHLPRAAVAVEQRLVLGDAAVVLDEVPLYASLPPYRGDVIVCQREVDSLTAVDVWLPASRMLLGDGEDLFAPRAPPLAECARCPIIATRTSAINTYVFDEGVLLDVAQLILSHMGCQFEVRVHDEDDFGNNSTFVGSFNRVIYGRADIVMRYLWATPSRHLCFDATDTLFIEKLDMWVRGEEPVTALNHTLALEACVVLGIALLAAVNESLLAFRRWAGMDGGERKPFQDAVLGVWALYAGQPGAPSHWAAWGRTLWAFVALLAVTLNCVRSEYSIVNDSSSLFASSAMQPQVYHVRTLEELIQKGATIAGHDRLLVPYLKHMSERAAVYSSPKVEDCYDRMEYCIQRLTSSRGDFVLLLNTADFMISIPVRERGRIFPLGQPFGMQLIVMYFSKGMPLVEHFSEVLGRVHTSGIIEQLYLRAMNYGITEARSQLTDGVRTPQSLSMQVLEPVVVKMALLLLPAALLCFLVEVVVGNLLRADADGGGQGELGEEEVRAVIAADDDVDRFLDAARGVELTWTVSVRLSRDAVR